MDEDEYTRVSNDGNNNINSNEEDEEASQEEDGNTAAQENNASTIIQATPTLASLTDPERIHQVREMTEAVWSLSTAKPGNGVVQIMDSSPDTYWQSDGPQPHLINIHFAKRKAICEVAFYLDYSLDESYTPKRIGIKAGVTFHDLEEIKVIEMNEPVGWITVPLYAAVDPLDDDLELDKEEELEDEEKERERRRKPLRTHFIQICILSMSQNGRDTHVRQVKIFGPRAEGDNTVVRAPSAFPLGLPRFQTTELSQFSTIR